MTIQYVRQRWRALGAVLLAAALAGCGAARPRPDDALALAPPSQSVLEADARLASVALDRPRAEAAFANAEQHCYTRFMVNNCLDKAREQRRATLSRLRAIEIEAERFLRQAKVDERDRELAKAAAEFEAEQARMAAAPPPVRAAAPLPSPSPAANPALARDRAAAQAAKLQNREAEKEAGAAKRAANLQAFEKRKRDSEQRQKEIAEKKKKAPSEGDGK